MNKNIKMSGNQIKMIESKRKKRFNDVRWAFQSTTTQPKTFFVCVVKNDI